MHPVVSCMVSAERCIRAQCMLSAVALLWSAARRALHVACCMPHAQRCVASRKFGVRSFACCRLSPALNVAATAVNYSRSTSGRVCAWQGGDAYFGSGTTCGVTADGPGCCSRARPCGSAMPGCPVIVAAPQHSSHGRRALQRSCDYSHCMSINNANIKSGIACVW
jgi:hypothetical protein